MKKLKLKIILLRLYISLFVKKYSTLCFAKRIRILKSVDTVKLIIDKRVSISRFGDGEFFVLNGQNTFFQLSNQTLSNRLKEVLESDDENLLVCIPKSLQSFQYLRIESRTYAIHFLIKYFDKFVRPYLSLKKVYGDSLLSRFYMIRKDKNNLGDYVDLLKKIWNNRNLLIVEGESTRLGIGNDLFTNAAIIRRILCPDANAFDSYEEIYRRTINQAHKEDLILISLGMTATVLAYDLSKVGFQAIDIGHIDIEYEWMIVGATEKVKVGNKQMMEVGCKGLPCFDSQYLSQVIDRI